MSADPWADLLSDDDTTRREATDGLWCGLVHPGQREPTLALLEETIMGKQDDFQEQLRESVRREQERIRQEQERNRREEEERRRRG